MDLNPAPILLVHHGSQELRDLIDAVARAEPDWRYLDRTGQRQRLWAVRDERDHRPASGTSSPAASASSPTATTGTPPTCDSRRSTRAPPWDAGLAMLVDQADTPLFLGAIHRTLPTVRLDVLVEATRAAGAEVTARSTAAGTRRPRQHAPGADGRRRRGTPSRPTASTARPPCRGCTTTSCPGCPQPPPRLEHHHTVEDALAATSPAAPAVLLPSPDFDAGQGARRVRGAPAGEGDLVPAEAEPRRASCDR